MVPVRVSRVSTRVPDTGVPMRMKRVFIEGAFYHVTSRTNNKVRAFERNLGQKIMHLTLQEAKEKFGFCLANFCIMPTHIHLLIKPENGTSLSKIMQWIKTQSAKRWNSINGTSNHLWGDRYFSRVIKNEQDYITVMNYIDQNPVRCQTGASHLFAWCLDPFLSGTVSDTVSDTVPDTISAT